MEEETTPWLQPFPCSGSLWQKEAPALAQQRKKNQWHPLCSLPGPMCASRAPARLGARGWEGRRTKQHSSLPSSQWGSCAHIRALQWCKKKEEKKEKKKKKNEKERRKYYVSHTICTQIYFLSFKSAAILSSGKVLGWKGFKNNVAFPYVSGNTFYGNLSDCLWTNPTFLDIDKSLLFFTWYFIQEHFRTCY